MILAKIDQFKAYYLPYELVRRPVDGKVTRENIDRKYRCRGYLEGTAINTSKQLDNLVLNMAEPFDWSQAQSFDYGFIGGHRVKPSDISKMDLKDRIREETESDFLPQVERVLHTTGVELNVTVGNMLVMPILVPMYFIRENHLTAVVNGQTGRVSASVGRIKKTIPWVIEPILCTIIATLIAGIPFKFDDRYMAIMPMLGLVLGIMTFAVMSDGRNSLIRKMTLRSKNVKAVRDGESLHITEGKNVLKNLYDNTPVFIKKNNQGKDVPVQIKFYTFGRIFFIFFRMFALMGMPIFLAAIIRFLKIKDTGEPFMDHFDIRYGAAWYVLMGFICLIYWVRGVRHDIYEHPLVYEMMGDGKNRLIGSRASRRVGFLSMFGIGKNANSLFELA